ncbi:MAG TPA: hypothetical protein VG106_11005, partial [Vicinamibacterales bacterium]|nr:hypothetical protein [Vicinamibacterales bacterium]
GLLAPPLLFVLAAASPVSAQGNGHGHAYGRFKGGASPSPSSGGAAQLQPQQPSGTGVRNFGAWLDDASLLPPGSGSLSVSFSYFRSPIFREFDVPVIDGGIGMMRRVQFGFSVPYYHANEPGGPVARGLGDLYLNAKVQLRDPAAHKSGVGFAVTPVLEVLSTAPGPDGSRYHWAIPVSIEVQRSAVRGFASAGYFSRGSLFASAALELAVSDRVWTTGAITRSHSTKPDDFSRSLGLAQSRTDVNGGVTVMMTPTVAAFGNVGRTISRRDANSASLVVSGGVSYSFSAWTK